MATQQTKNGIVGLEFMKNIRTFIADLQTHLTGTTQTVNQTVLDKLVVVLKIPAFGNTKNVSKHKK
ncbi:MAG TPA: hypothetical protein DER09_03190 [Prolixibacteraceae bacterium]|nr:hypothetical protein [Prolixibacteraceae bacterium]